MEFDLLSLRELMKAILQLLAKNMGVLYLLLLLIPVIYLLIKFRKLNINYTHRHAKWTISIIILIAILLMFLTGILIWYNPLNLKNYNPDFGGLVGGSISGIVTLLVIRFTVTIDEKKSFAKARISAGILDELLKSIYCQIERLNIGENSKIYYVKNWLDYYSDVSYLAKYDYLDQLSMEFNFVDRLNELIEKDDKKKIQELLKMRKNYIFTSTNNFNIHEIQFNLGAIKIGFTETQPWMEQKKNIKIVKYIQENYYYIVENWIYNKLLKVDNCELQNIEGELVQWLKKYEYFNKIYDDRIILKAIIDICCDFKRKSLLISFCWNELSLKDKVSVDVKL